MPIKNDHQENKTESRTGGCACGANRFEFTLPTMSVSHCHCEDCRRTHGAAFVTWVSVARERFRLLPRGESFRQYESHPGVRWGFCAACGVSFHYECDDEPEVVYVTRASVEAELDRGPRAHVSYEERAPWLEGWERLPKYWAKTDKLAPLHPPRGKFRGIKQA